jgi:hypothetical protein
MRRFILVLLSAILFTIAFRVLAFPPTVGPGFYDDRIPIYDYQGTWGNSSDANDFYSTAKFTTAYLSYFTAQFTGDGITLYFVKFSSAGDIIIIIDGGAPIAVNLFNATSIFKFAVEITGLGGGVHYLSVTKDDNTTDGVYFDGALIHAELTPTPQATFDFSDIQIELTLELTLEVAPPAWINEFTVPDGEGGEQNVAFSYEVTAGDLSQVILIAATLIAVLVLLVVTVRGST